MAERRNVGAGYCLGIGGTNARIARCEDGKISEFSSESTPAEPQGFFSWVAEKVVYASEHGAEWIVVGLPGLVKNVADEQFVGPLPNVPGLSDHSHNFVEEIEKVNQTAADILKSGFLIRVINDGELVAFAAAEEFGTKPDGSYHNSVASIIIGTGVGGAIVRRDPIDKELFRLDGSLLEVGHLPVADDTTVTFESLLSGPSLTKRHNAKPEHMGSDHVVWQEVAQIVGRMVMITAMANGVDLVVMCGGVGANSFDHYKQGLDEYLDMFRTSSNAVQRAAVPDEIRAVPADRAHDFEMHGAEGVIRDYLASSRSQ